MASTASGRPGASANKRASGAPPVPAGNGGSVKWPFSSVIQREIKRENQKEKSAPEFGFIKYTFNWGTTEPHRRGYIVQKITRQDPEDEGEVYWEAWWVSDNGDLYSGSDLASHVPSPHDTWSRVPLKLTAVKGQLSINGEVYWAADATPAKKAIDAWEVGAVETAGASLRSSKTEPAGVERVSAADDSKAWQLGGGSTGGSEQSWGAAANLYWKKNLLDEYQDLVRFAKAADDDDDDNGLGALVRKVIGELKGFLGELKVEERLLEEKVRSWFDKIPAAEISGF